MPENQTTPLWSYWRDTPWVEIKETARLTLSRDQFTEWLGRPEVLERANQKP